MRKNTQKIAFFILIPMLLFSFIVTVSSQSISQYNDSNNVIYQYFKYRNNNDYKSIEKLLLNKQDIAMIISDSNSINNLRLISIKEENNQSLRKAYLKNNDTVLDTDLLIYKVKYQVTYDYSKSSSYKKSGIYDSWYFLVRKDSSTEWLIDIGDI